MPCRSVGGGRTLRRPNCPPTSTSWNDTCSTRSRRLEPTDERDRAVDADAEIAVPLDQIFGAQIDSRLLDHTARWLRAVRSRFYTIGSAGHESNAAAAAALRPNDPALLHYRSGGFYCARSAAATRPRCGGRRPRRDAGTRDEPIAGGRHKVFGHRTGDHPPDLDDRIAPATCARRLLRIRRAAGRVGVEGAWPGDAIAVCSFGDASANHSTAQGAINAAAYTSYAGLPVPLLFVCEDNGLGISVPTPNGWIDATLSNRPGLGYAVVDGTDPVAVFHTAARLAADVRSTGRPAVLHLRTVRYLGHAGTDVETAYRSSGAIRGDYGRDPILGTARALVDRGADPSDLVDRYLARRRDPRAGAGDERSTPARVGRRGGRAPVAATAGPRAPPWRRPPPTPNSAAIKCA
ncbi:MAG: thiamine pyrophosphate-dependent enzyme [Ilumatobacteraceae bacterium]